jgi:hypothetical protein
MEMKKVTIVSSIRLLSNKGRSSNLPVETRSREHMVRTPGTGDTTGSIQPALQDMSLKEPSYSNAKATYDLKASNKHVRGFESVCSFGVGI